LDKRNKNKMKNHVFIIVFFAIILGGFTLMQSQDKESEVESIKIPDNAEKAIFAGGCFWCMEAVFQETEGVISVVSGYTGGEKENPTYEEVISGNTGHYETVEIIYDPKDISYKSLLDIFWRNIDPVDDLGQFVDKGSQYKTAIFYLNETQKDLAEKSKKDLEDSGNFDKQIVTEVLPAQEFYNAEEYHQDYYKKRTLQYNLYNQGSGRKERLKDLWG